MGFLSGFVSFVTFKSLFKWARVKKLSREQ